MITENLSTLKIHKLTQEQYDREYIAGNIDKNAWYLTPDNSTKDLQILDTTWEQGSFQYTSGSNQVSTNRIRSEYLQDNTLILVASDGYQMILHAWNNNDTYIGRLVAGNVFSNAAGSEFMAHTTINLADYPSDYKYKITVKREDNENMTSSEGDNICFITVVDVSVLKKKFEYLQTYITPQMFGAKGDGTTDDTYAINLAINSLSDGGTIYFPPGVYIVNHGGTNYTSAITVTNKNNITFKLDNAAKIKHSLTNSSYYRIVEFTNCNSVEVCGGIIEGEADEHTNREISSNGNLHNISSYCLHLTDCHNVYIHDIKTTNCYGDGMGIATSSDSIPQLENVLIENCSVHDLIRNGIVYSGVKNGIIRNCHIYNIAPDGQGVGTGCLPMAGIDLEAHYSAKNENIVIEGCYIHDCGQNTIIHSRGTYGTTIRNCNLLGLVSEASNSDNLNLFDSNVSTVITRNTAMIQGCVLKHLGIYNDTNEEMSDATVTVNDSIINGSDHGTAIHHSRVVAKVCFKNCTFNHTSEQIQPLFYATESEVDITLEHCKIHLWENENETFVFGNKNFKNITILNSTFMAESETFTKKILEFDVVDRITFVGNTIDMTKVINYGQNAIVTIKTADKDVTCSNNTFLSSVFNSSLCSDVFNGVKVTGNLYIVNNNAPTWDSIIALPTTDKIAFVRNNILSTTPNLDSATEEIWTFTLGDGTTIEKKVVII